MDTYCLTCETYDTGRSDLEGQYYCVECFDTDCIVFGDDERFLEPDDESPAPPSETRGQL